MKSLRKLTTALLALLLTFGIATPAFAASESDIISALKDAKMPQTYIIQTENYLNANEVTSAQADTIIAEIKKADAIMAAAGTTDVTKLTESDKTKVLEYIKNAAGAIGLTVTVEARANGYFEFTFKDASGNIVSVFTSNQVKQTGANNLLFAAGIALMITAAASSLVLRKKVAVQ
ncbi:MAG: hypothetical protein HGA49_01050 [Eubacteriaceae bacterium]|nr:hypothetical protein [Eubacteriaceae bacterium]